MALIAWQIVGCILLADFLTGLGHWFEDTYSVPTWPILGRIIAEPNINHHLQPNEMAPTFWERNKWQLIPAWVFLIGLATISLLTWEIALIINALALGNETHSWCHKKVSNPLITLLQDMGISINPRQHHKHHKHPYEKTFCTLTNFVNPVVDRLQLWRFLEWIIAKLGIPPKRGTEQRNFV